MTGTNIGLEDTSQDVIPTISDLQYMPYVAAADLLLLAKVDQSLSVGREREIITSKRQRESSEEIIMPSLIEAEVESDVASSGSDSYDYEIENSYVSDKYIDERPPEYKPRPRAKEEDEHKRSLHQEAFRIVTEAPTFIHQTNFQSLLDRWR